MRSFARRSIIAGIAMLVAGQVHAQNRPATPPTVAEAQRFVQRAERELWDLSIRANQAGWVAANFITDDTEALSAEHQKNLAVAIQRYALEAKRFERLQLPAELRRKLEDDPSKPRHILTVRKAGYRLQP